MSVAIGALFAASGAQAAISSFELIAVGSLTGTSDLSGLSGNLESGVAKNVLGGMGSGLAYAGGNTFLAAPDRGPNATPYNSAVEDTTTYIPRFQTVSMNLSATPSGSYAYSLTPTLQATTLLYSPTALTYGTGGTPSENTTGKYYFTGRSDAFDAAQNSLYSGNGRFDPEGIRTSNDGSKVYISDEYGTYLYEFNRATGERTRAFALPGNLAVATQGPTTASEGSPTNTSGRVGNKGMEGLAITPDGKTLVGIVQAPALQDVPTKNVRIVSVDIESGATKEFAYTLTTGSGVSEILAINDHEFLVDERDGKGLGDGTSASVKQIFKIDLANAEDVTSLSGSALTSKAVSKTLFLDVKAKMVAKGITATNVPAKMEAMAWGADITDNGELFHTLWLANDNDFLPNVAGQNNFYVFAVKASDLTSFQAQPVPLPAAAFLMAPALAGLTRLRRRKA